MAVQPRERKTCSLKRKEIYFKALKGEFINEKIIHNNEIKAVIEKGNNKIISEQNARKLLGKKKVYRVEQFPTWDKIEVEMEEII